MSDFGMSDEACKVDPHCGMKTCCPCPACNDQDNCLDMKCRKLKNYWVKQAKLNRNKVIKHV